MSKTTEGNNVPVEGTEFQPAGPQLSSVTPPANLPLPSVTPPADPSAHAAHLLTYIDHKYGVEIPISDIKLDLAVQRTTIPGRVRKIAKYFNPDFIGELLVSQRGDGYYVLDGGHRVSACQVTGEILTMTCEVYTGLSKPDESRLFMGRNDRANIAKLDKDRNLNTAEEPVTMDIHHACAASGYVFIANSAEESTFRDRAAAITVMNDSKKKGVLDDGPEHLRKVLDFYARTWDSDHRPSSPVLKGLSKVLASQTVQQGIVDLVRLEERLHGIPDQQVEAMALTYREQVQTIKGITPATAVVEIITDQYNKGLPVEKRVRFH